MPNVQTVRKRGDRMVAYFDDGSELVFYKSTAGIYIRRHSTGTPQGSGGETTSNGGTPTNTPGTVTAAVDDYPWPHAPENDLSPLRYSYRDCVDFVAWRINRDHSCLSAPWQYTWAQLRPAGGDGDAIGWYHDWQILGWAVDVTPAAGVIGYFGSSVGAYGHVNYVQSVTGTTAHVEEYNWGDTQAYGTRDVPFSDFDSFLRMPPP